ncbi:hypothetical protein Taro_016826 [Colocasia esculenta]|uniref:Uncharacterized protein n=1 Tax=Colocasia esculenta TaxID=4460 RepID=A0A843URD9_COLES|nr:hypothetical protein [Colocasia esculenta]
MGLPYGGLGTALGMVLACSGRRCVAQRWRRGDIVEAPAMHGSGWRCMVPGRGIAARGDGDGDARRLDGGSWREAMEMAMHGAGMGDRGERRWGGRRTAPGRGIAARGEGFRVLRMGRGKEVSRVGKDSSQADHTEDKATTFLRTTAIYDHTSMVRRFKRIQHLEPSFEARPR